MRALLREALLASPLPWLDLASLPGLLALEPAAAAELASQAQSEGLLELWVVEGAARLAPTPLGAERLGLRLRNDSRWVGADRPDRPVRAKGKAQSLAEIEHLIVDERPPPSDADLSYFTGLWREPPYPAILLGLRHVWTGPHYPRPCPCHGARIGPVSYCLVCDLWGWERGRKRKGRKSV